MLAALGTLSRQARTRFSTMASDMFLYWGSGSPPCWKVIIVLEEKGLKYDHKLLSFAKNEHQSEEILKLNPRGQLPVLRHGDIIVSESSAACHYLESEFPSQGTKLIPDEAAQKARVLQLTYEAENLQTSSRAFIRYLMTTKKEDQDPELVKTKKEAWVKELRHWEDVISKSPEGSYLAGKDFSMADVSFFPVVAMAFRSGLRSESFPRLGAYYERLSQRPSVKSKWPPHWLESPPQTHLSDI